MMLAAACEDNQKFSTALEPGSRYSGKSHGEFSPPASIFEVWYEIKSNRNKTEYAISIKI